MKSLVQGPTARTRPCCSSQGNVAPEPPGLPDHVAAVAALLLVLLVFGVVDRPGLWWWQRSGGDRWEGAVSGSSAPPRPLATASTAPRSGCGAAPGVLLSQSHAPWGRSVASFLRIPRLSPNRSRW